MTKIMTAMAVIGTAIATTCCRRPFARPRSGAHHHFCRALERAAHGRSRSSAGMEPLGVDGVEAIIAQQGDLGSF
jgi:hypothetical protein